MNKRTVAALTIFGGLTIFIIKIYAWLISGSVALLSDALESIVNILASIMMYGSVLISEKPPDDNHMYGHQKIEGISCLIEGILIIIAGVLIGKAAYGRLIKPVLLEKLDFAVIISLFATSLNGILSYLLGKTAKMTNSMALEGDANHLLSDVVSSLGIAFGLFIGQIQEFYFLILMTHFFVRRVFSELFLLPGTHTYHAHHPPEGARSAGRGWCRCVGPGRRHPGGAPDRAPPGPGPRGACRPPWRWWS